MILVRKFLLQSRHVLAHFVTHMGRDHGITISDVNMSLMIANVHLQPGTNLRNLCAIREQWPDYLAGLGILLGDFNICEIEERRFNATTQAFSDGDPGRTATFRSVFPRALERVQPGFTRKAAAPDGTLRILSGTENPSIKIPLPKLRIFIAMPMGRMIWEIGPYQETILRSVSLFRNRATVQQRTVLCNVGSQNTLVSCSSLKQLHDEHDYPIDAFAALAHFKLLLGKARTRTGLPVFLQSFLQITTMAPLLSNTQAKREGALPWHEASVRDALPTGCFPWWHSGPSSGGCTMRIFQG